MSRLRSRLGVGPPLSAQILLLLLGGLVVAQLATLALTLLWPPPAPAQYRLEDIAAALGDARPARGAPLLERTVRSEPPSLRSAGWLVSERSRHDLARLTGAQEADVRLLFFSPPPFAGAGGGGLADAGGPASGRVVDLAMAGASGPLRVALLQPPGGGFGGGGDRGGFGGSGGGGGFGLGRARGERDGAGRPGRRQRKEQGAGSDRGPGGSGAGAEAPVSSAPTTIDPPGSHEGAWLSLHDVTGLARPGASAARPVTGAPAAGAPAAARPAGSVQAPFAAPASGSIVGAQGPAFAASPDFAPDPPTRRSPLAAASPDRDADDAAARARASPAPPAHPAVALPPPPVVATRDDPSEQVAEAGVIAPAPLVAARSGDTGGYVVRAPDIAPRGLFGLAPAPFVQGDFVAAVRVGPGRWVTVRPRPEPFPNGWQRRVLLWFALAFALVAPVGWLFARRLARPLGAFAAAAERLGRDPSGAAVALSGPAEIGRAARAFSIMQARLKRFVDDRTAMVGAISHDLRTPLARMRFRMERAPPELRDGMLHDISQMEEMISSVLVFIRDASEPSIRERVDLRSILECVVDDAALVGGEAVLDPGAPLSVEVDALGVQRVLTNLVDNALKYGARAAVRMYAEGDEAVAEVADDGPGLAPEELERVFLPFYRSQGARSLNTGGIGLGLAVSRSIARAHGGDVRLIDGEGRGVRAQLRLPLAASAAA